MKDCPHRPPCPTTNPVACHQRTQIEDALEAQHLTRAEGERLARLFGTVLTPASRVYKGEPRTSARMDW